MMKGLFVRKEKSNDFRNSLINKEIVFFEESKSFYTLFLFPEGIPEITGGKIVDLINENDIGNIEIPGQTFKIDGTRDLIDIFAPKIIERGFKVKLDNPDTVLEIHRWGNKYVINVSLVSH